MLDSIRISKIINFRDLEVWQRAIELTDLVYDITAKFPGEERSALGAQMRKAAVSIPSNIAEGTRHRTAYAIAVSRDSLTQLRP